MKAKSVSRRDCAKELKSLWVTNALDGSEDCLVSERVYKLVGTRTTFEIN